MKEIKLACGAVYLTFYVFANGNALYVRNGKVRTIEDFADKYIKLRENGFEDVQ